jgi:hypothetical protein
MRAESSLEIVAQLMPARFVNPGGSGACPFWRINGLEEVDLVSDETRGGLEFLARDTVEGPRTSLS